MAGKLVLHIGATKTGTSAIQSALVRNRATLRAHGVLFPEGRQDSKAEEGRTVAGNSWMLHSHKHLIDSQPKGSLRQLSSWLGDISSTGDCHTVILSGEAMGRYDATTLGKLKPVLDRYFDEYRIVYFVRHLADHAVSQYGEYVKRRRMKKPFAAFAANYKARFKATLKAYETAFGPEAVTCILYDDVRDRVFEAFLESVGLPADGMEMPPAVNRSLSADEIAVFRALNAKGFPRVHVSKLVQDYTFTHPARGRRTPDIPKAALEAIERNNARVLKAVNKRLTPPSRLLAISDRLKASVTEEAPAEPPLDPDILFDVLETSLRRSQALAEEAAAGRNSSGGTGLRAPRIETTPERLKRWIGRLFGR